MTDRGAYRHRTEVDLIEGLEVESVTRVWVDDALPRCPRCLDFQEVTTESDGHEPCGACSELPPIYEGEYRWDFTHDRPSFRKGGRVALCHGKSTRVKQWIAPEDQDAFRQQYEQAAHISLNLAFASGRDS